MAGTPEPQQNQILDALPLPERERLFPHLRLVTLPLGKVLYESGDTLRHIYFPTDSIVSLLYVFQNGQSAEIAVVGNDGAIGVALFMGGETTTNRAIVQSAGSAYRRRVRASRRDPAHSAALHTGIAHTDVSDRSM
jgi:CRP-like cAMP-binding protein